jgi:AraC family transcriptional regulator
MELARLEDAQLKRLEEDRAHRLLYVGAQIAVGEFHCPPEDPRWSQENCIEEGYFVAFPGTSVVIGHTGREPAVMSRNEVVLYNQGESYRRGLLDRSGDHCVFLMVARGLLAEMATALGATQTSDRVAFSAHVGSVAASTFLQQRLLVRALRSRPVCGDLQLEEALYRLVFDAARIGFRNSQPERRPARRRTLRAHALLVEKTKALLARRFAERLSLAQIARELHVSPFHLSHVFQAWTGFGVHEYRDQLRLRSALDRILDRDATLSELAYELGYASHSHFTDSFRRAFGVPPTGVRGATAVAARSGYRASGTASPPDRSPSPRRPRPSRR